MPRRSKLLATIVFLVRRKHDLSFGMSVRLNPPRVSEASTFPSSRSACTAAISRLHTITQRTIGLGPPGLPVRYLESEELLDLA